MKMKKAQITTIISIGVILIIAVAVFLFIRGYLLTDIEPERVVPIEMIDIDDFIHDCLDQVSREAIEILGLQGGYIYIPDHISRVDGAYIELVENGDIKIPLWYHLGNYRMPFISDMERDINRFIIENLPLCLNDFEYFEHKYEVIDYEIQPSTYISETDVYINVKYPLEITNLANNQQAKIDTFNSRQDVKLREAYNLARDILITNEGLGFLEQVAIDLMVIDPEIPFSGIEFTCSRKRWSLNSLRERAKGLFTHNLPLIRIQQTDYMPFAEDENYESLHLFWNLSTDREYKNFNTVIRFNPIWDFYLTASPNDGNNLISSVGDMSFIGNICINNYHYIYDVRFPLKFKLFDSSSFSNEGFEFLFGLPVYIEHNDKLRDNFGYLQTLYAEEDEEFCSFRLPEVKTFRAYDKRTGLAIENVEFNFDCILRRCNLGNTTFTGDMYEVEASLPEFCNGGFLKATHPDYEETSKLIYYDDLPNLVQIYMREMKTLELDITKHRTNNLFIPMSIPDDQHVLITYTDKSINKTDYLVYPSNQNIIRLPYEASSIEFELLLVDNSDLTLGGYYNVFNYTREDIADANTLRLKVYEKRPAPIDLEESTELYSYILNETRKETTLQPELVFR